MRYKDFKIVETKLKEAGEVYVIGDSHAKAMGGSNNLAANGARLSAIARQANRVPDGATVYMTGGHNDVTTGSSPQNIANAVASIINNLKSKDCTVNYILFPEGSENENQENMAPTRTAINNAVDVAQDLNGCSMQGDGIHCSLGSYRGIVNSSAATASSRGRAAEDEGGLQSGPPYPRGDMDRVRAMQSKLEDLGYSVGSTGVDGKYGPRTSRAARGFKQDNNLEGDGLSMSREDLQKLASAEPVANPTPTNQRVAARDEAPRGRPSSENVRTAMGFFFEKGFTAAQVAGIVGNLQAESGQGIDPSAVGDGGQAHGIAQWHPDRRENFEREFGKPFSESTYEEQLEFIWWELNNTERRAMRYLRQARTAEEAAAVFDQYYERSSGAHRDRRMANATNLMRAASGLAIV